MQFMMLVKHGSKMSGPPPKALIDAIDKMAADAVKDGSMLGTGGLAPIEKSTSVRLANGQVSVIDGPFAEAKEVVGGYAQFEFKSKEEAVKSAVEFMELHRKLWPGWEGETEVRQIFGPQDFAQHVAELARMAG